jgi:hypothetical protein
MSTPPVKGYHQHTSANVSAIASVLASVSSSPEVLALFTTNSSQTVTMCSFLHDKKTALLSCLTDYFNNAIDRDTVKQKVLSIRDEIIERCSSTS